MKLEVYLARGLRFNKWHTAQSADRRYTLQIENSTTTVQRNTDIHKRRKVFNILTMGDILFRRCKQAGKVLTQQQHTIKKMFGYVKYVVARLRDRGTLEYLGISPASSW